MPYTSKQLKLKKWLTNLDEEDVSSALLFSLYKLHNDPKYSTLSELPYIIDGSRHDLLKFLSYYEGKTITIPSANDYRTMIAAARVWEAVEFEGTDLNVALRVIATGDLDKAKVLEFYETLSTVMETCNFKRIEQHEVAHVTSKS